MKFAYLAALATAVTVSLGADNTTLTTCQQSCVDSTIASNSTCGSSFEACACDNTFAQNVKICLYQGSCSSDVSTWFDVATEACESTGTDANYTSTHSSNYTYSESAGAAATSSPVSAGGASATSAAASAASSSASASGASAVHQFGVVGAALTVVGAVGSALLF